MTLEEIKALITTYTEQVNDPRVYDEDIAATRAALLRAVEGIVRERDRAESALVARHGGEPLALLAELDEARGALKAAEWQSYSGHEWNRLLNERDAFRVRAEAAEKERDEAEQKLAQSEDRVIAIGTDLARSESALAAMREALALAYDLLRHLYTTGGGRYALHPDSPNPQTVIDAVYRALASPPPAALSTETQVKP